MLLNRLLTSTIVLTFLQFLACENLGYRGVNSGKWELIAESSLLHTAPIRPIKFFDQNNGLAIQGVSIQGTNDSGKAWSTVFFEEAKSIAAGAFVSESEGWAVGTANLAKPLVLRTTDGGKHWLEIPFVEESAGQVDGKYKVLWDICFDPEGSAWLTGEGGILQVRLVEGHLRVLSSFPSGEASDRISCSSSGDVWALGRGNWVFQFRDGWVKKKLDPGYILSNIRTFRDSVWVIGKDGTGNGILLQSRDSGVSWQNKTPKDAKSLNDLFLQDGSGWLVGAEGNIYYTTDNGETWLRSDSPTNANLSSIYGLDQNNVWISGDRETILKYRR